jgi:addiction module HigA family antidote
MTTVIEDIARLDFSDAAGAEPIGPVTPGNLLHHEFLVPLGLSGRALARELGVPSNRVTEIVAGGRAITAETAIPLGERFGTAAAAAARGVGAVAAGHRPDFQKFS